MSKSVFVLYAAAVFALALFLAAPGQAQAADGLYAAGNGPDPGWERKDMKEREKAWQDEMKRRGKNSRDDRRFDDRRPDHRDDYRQDRREGRDERRFDDRRDDRRGDRRFDDRRDDRRGDRRYDGYHHPDDHGRNGHWRDRRSYYDGHGRHHASWHHI